MTRIDANINDRARVYFRYASQMANAYTGVPFFPDSNYTPSNQNNLVLVQTGGYRG
jgi:hypothetical protein